MYRGRRAVRSVPAETELAEILVPSWARANPVAIIKIPKRWPELAPFKNMPRRSRGFQTGSVSKITDEEDDTIIPINEVIPNPIGIVSNCDHSASFGVRANRVKSGSFIIRAAKLPMQLMIALTIVHPRALPWTVLDWCTIGPIPWAREIAHAKKAMAAIGE